MSRTPRVHEIAPRLAVMQALAVAPMTCMEVIRHVYEKTGGMVRLVAVPREMRELRRRGMVAVDSQTWRYRLTPTGRRKATSQARAILAFLAPALSGRRSAGAE
jgi:hypothetical protein